MSLDINPDKITEVLVSGQWIAIRPGTFDIGGYNFAYSSYALLSAGESDDVTATGFGASMADESGHRICGPLTALQAVKVRP